MSEKKSAYQIIARKFRPQTFAEVMGQQAIVTTLKNAIRFKRTAQAYLFCGSRGTGKTTLARLFAKALNCSNLSESGEPCNSCPSCMEITSGHSLDILEIDGASNRGIDDIRKINETVGYAPATGNYKIYIIDEVHMLTKEAFNALLKTLEEPPLHVKFFFATTEPHKVLPTITSRCQRFDLSGLAPEVIQAKLSRVAQELKIDAEEEALALIAHLSEGSLRDAESLFDQVLCHSETTISKKIVASVLGILPRTAFFALDEAIANSKLSFAFELTERLFSEGKDIAYFVESLLEHFRTLLLFKMSGSPRLSSFLSEEERKQYQQSASLYTEEQCLYIIDFLIEWLQQSSKNPFKRVALEALLLRILRSRHRIPLEALVKRLVQLEAAVKTEKAPSLESKLLQTIKEKIAEAPTETKVEPTPQPAAATPKGKHETLIRFAAVEWEGTIKKG